MTGIQPFAPTEDGHRPVLPSSASRLDQPGFDLVAVERVRHDHRIVGLTVPANCRQ